MNDELTQRTQRKSNPNFSDLLISIQRVISCKFLLKEPL